MRAEGKTLISYLRGEYSFCRLIIGDEGWEESSVTDTLSSQLVYIYMLTAAGIFGLNMAVLI